MLYSLGFGMRHLAWKDDNLLTRYLGMVNFFFCLPAMRTIDTSGRRAWLLATLPVMCLMLVGAAAADPAEPDQGRHVTAIVFIFCKMRNRLSVSSTILTDGHLISVCGRILPWSG